MSFLRSALLLLCLALAGCQPGLPSGDEQKESHFLAAKNRVQERDYDGAIELFEKSLDVNPRSASAHFELGILYQQHRNDFAAALYHLQKAVALRPDSSASELAKQQMEVCKRELARTVMQLPSMGELQRKIDALRDENQTLKERLQAWQSYYEGRGVTLSNVTQTGSQQCRGTQRRINFLSREPDRNGCGTHAHQCSAPVDFTPIIRRERSHAHHCARR
jgi:tetratricopeptide (TPR) repeat protein